MKRNLTKRLAPLLLIAVLGVACQGSQNGGSPSPVTPNNHETGGTDNTGGGNGARGRALDSYIEKNLTETPAFKNHVQPLIEILSREYPRLAADFYHITYQRDWYFIPVELDEISKNVLGTYAKTDQYALQDLNKIWIDKNKFEAMTSVQDQGTLLIHEIMMGIRLMHFQAKQDHCIAKAALLIFQPVENKNYGDQRRSCRRTYPVIDGSRNLKFKLSADDYDLIRKLVSLLDRTKPDIAEVQSLIEAHSFRSYRD